MLRLRLLRLRSAQAAQARRAYSTLPGFYASLNAFVLSAVKGVKAVRSLRLQPTRCPFGKIAQNSVGTGAFEGQQAF